MTLKTGALALALLASGCARPYAGPKTLAGIGASLLVVGGGTWAVADRAERGGVANVGAAVAALGAVAALAAGGWLAAGVACRADPDCPAGEQCREIPAPPGGEPYRQCMRR